MRSALAIAILVFCLPTHTLGQVKPPDITKVQVGFHSQHKEEQSAYKVGLWTPVYVDVFGGSEGIDARAGTEAPYLQIETVDSEDVGTRIRVPIAVKPLETVTVMGYVKTGRMGRSSTEVRVLLYQDRRERAQRTIEHFLSLDVDAFLYLTIGAPFLELRNAVEKLDKKAEDRDVLHERIRHVAFENKERRLPEAWFGYDSVDLLFLATSNRDFLTKLSNDPKRLGAIAQWVRRGGRLIVPIAPAQQDAVADLLRSGVWNPPIPVAPPRDGTGPALTSLPYVANWGGSDKAFQFINPRTQQEDVIPLARLDDGNTPEGLWDVLVTSGSEKEDRPLITRVRYGLGQIVYFPFSFDDAAFTRWEGREKFLQTLVQRLGPKAASKVDEPGGIGAARRSETNDLATDLVGKLDDFDVAIIPFQHVALFILLYILIVGPLDYVLLKYAFNRLEWTWITFPVVVLSISVLAYFAAYALKGHDQKINKIDIVDFDLRTNEKAVYAFGHSYFTILSPRIQNYTIGLEPNTEFWGEKADKAGSVDLLAWLGRPSGGPYAMRRSGSSGFFRNPYGFREDASGLERVPIPVWTTKAFGASWERRVKTPPFTANLTYHRKQVRGQDVKLSGTLANHLAVDLIDAWIIYDDRCYPLADGLKSIKPRAAPPALTLLASADEDIKNWGDPSKQLVDAEPRAWKADPAALVKTILFHEKIDTQHSLRNHLLRPLDLGWRLRAERRDVQGHRGVREAILFARVRSLSGKGEALTTDANTPLPTKLWLGDLPEPGKTRPELLGDLNQETYIRALLPVHPAKE